ncbi:hypothetical protein HMPREF9630_00197 [Peptoanaerobacter stomatis]|uniref:PF13711 domain protein n=1 Tax=Peptoanaerobacter stomatis TaxID=796937 RepID=V9HSI4_9FIRM|nr:DUF4160 domain-containing protein [Peptoanaerobacter stomatis]EHL18472.1 hypothetical protein HMPREF9630_00197 [Peptoanaerobacter stomatis]
MPEITRFYGILIKIFFVREHNPPHFHAVYGEYNGTFDIATLEMLEGDLPIKAQKLIQEWASQYQDRLMNMWNTKTLEKLPPLV